MAAVIDSPTHPQHLVPADGLTPVIALVLTAADLQIDLVVQSLASSTRRPDLVLVIERTGESAPARELVAALADADLASRLHEVSRPVGLREAVVLAVAQLDLADVFDARAGGALFWLIPPGTVPQPDTLRLLLDDWRRSPSVGMVGPKHVSAEDPTRLRSLGIHPTRAGRLVGMPAPGTPDQGQYDTTTDVLAVPLGGLLIEAELLEELRGWDGAFVDVAADLDLGWRAQRLGRRVVVSPRARMLTRPGIAIATADTALRRRSARMVALTRVSGWAVIPLMVWMAVTSVVGAVGLLLAKRPRAAAAELGELLALRPLAIAAARRRTRHTPVVAPRDLRSLFVPGRSIIRQSVDAVHDAIVPPRDPLGGAAHDLRPRSLMGRIVAHPAVLLPSIVLVLVAIAARTLGSGALAALSNGLVGGELVAGPGDASALWASWRDSWRGSGMGGVSSGEPMLGIMAILSWLVEHIPFVPDPHAPAGATAAIVLLLGMPTAAVTAYLSARVVAVDRVARALVALLWAVNPVTFRAVGEGRLGVVLATVILPLVGAGLWLTASGRGTATSGFATGLGLGLLTAAAPSLGVLVAMILIAMVVALPRARGRALVALAAAAGTQIPWLLDVIAEPARLLAGPGLVDWADRVPAPWTQPLLYAAPALVLAALSLLVGRGVRDVRTPLTAIAVFSLLAVLVASQVSLATLPDGRVLRPWAPALALLAMACLLAAILLTLTEPAWRQWGRWFAGISAGALAVGAVVPGLGTLLSPWQDVRPSVAVDQAENFFATRSLQIPIDGTSASYRLVGKETYGPVRSLPTQGVADGALADEVAGLLAGRPSEASLLGAAAVDLVALQGEVTPALSQRFDTTAGFSPIPAPSGWAMWRHTPADGAAATVAPPRLRIVGGKGGSAIAVQTTGSSGATSARVHVPAAGRLIVAEPLAWTSSAVVSVDGVRVQADPRAELPTYAVDAGTHDITITVTPSHPWPRRLSLVWIVILGFLAIPFGTRASRIGEGR